MSSTWVTILSAAGGILGAVLTFVGTRWNNRSAVRAQRETLRIERDKVDAAAYSEARQIWDSTIAALKSENDSKSAEISNLRVSSAADRAELERVSKGFSSRGHTIDLLKEYVSSLLKFIRKNRLTPPPAPEGVEL